MSMGMRLETRLTPQFILMMRLYWPTETPPSLLDGTWKVPEVKEVS
jgi:hypothetical protein